MHYFPTEIGDKEHAINKKCFKLQLKKV